MTWEDLQAILVNPTTPKGERRGGGTVAKDAAAAAEEEQQEEEADENAGPTNQHTKPSRQAQRQLGWALGAQEPMYANADARQHLVTHACG